MLATRIAMARRLAAVRAFGATATALVRAGADARSRLRLVVLRALRGDQREGQAAVTTVRVRALGGEAVALRRGTHDIYAFSDAYVGFEHLPRSDVTGSQLGQILELGTNIGLGLAEMAHRYPQARLVGVEADPENARLAKRNVRRWQDRCRVVSAAVWDSDTELTIDAHGDSHGHVVRERRPDDHADRPTIPAFTVQTILDLHMPEGRIDYVLLSAERSEQRVLTSACGWLGRVDAIKVETYTEGPYSPEDTVADLERLGFRAWLEPNPWGGFALGVRSP
jgi:FkbM family methyltransferase